MSVFPFQFFIAISSFCTFRGGMKHFCFTVQKEAFMVSNSVVNTQHVLSGSQHPIASTFKMIMKYVCLKNTLYIYSILVNVSLEQTPEDLSLSSSTNTSFHLLLSSQIWILSLCEASLLPYRLDEAGSCFFFHPHQFTQSVFAVAGSIYFMPALALSKQTVKHGKKIRCLSFFYYPFKPHWLTTDTQRTYGVQWTATCTSSMPQ